MGHLIFILTTLVLLAGFVVTALLLAWLFSVASRIGDPLTMHVYPSGIVEPVNIRVELLVPRHSDNRVLAVSAQGESFARSSAWDIPGQYAPVVYAVEWRAFPAGTYLVTAELRGIKTVRWLMRQPLTVLAR